MIKWTWERNQVLEISIKKGLLCTEPTL
jgi:hypothetical protein